MTKRYGIWAHGVGDNGAVPGDLISSATNPLIRRIRSLEQRRTRRREGAFVVAGIAPVWQAVEAGADIEVLVIAPALLAGSPALGMVGDQEQRGTPVARLTAELFARLSDRDGPSGLAAVVRGRLGNLSDLTVTPGDFYVAAYEVANPGNVGTIIRTADALGAAGVALVGDSTDPFSPQAVKASMGSLFAVPVVQESSLEAVFDWAEAAGVTTVATSAHAPHRLSEAPLELPLIVLLGSERTGLPAEALARSATAVSIPMVGRASSLNLAVAAGITLYEVRRRLG